jgi:hypothetical protein
MKLSDGAKEAHHIPTRSWTLRGEVRPHPLSWFLFGILSATGHWEQRGHPALI